MSRDWKPGDVALFRVIRWTAGREWPDDTSRVLMRLDEEGRYWEAVDGDPAAPFAVHYASEYLHPLVVIDPEDAEQVERLCDGLYGDHNNVVVHRLQAALREYASPTPPRPDEPQGLGAVVEDAEGRQWVRTNAHIGPWLNRISEKQCEWRLWTDVKAVRKLSEGVR